MSSIIKVIVAVLVVNFCILKQSLGQRPCLYSLTRLRLQEIKEILRPVLFQERLAHAVRIAFHDCVGGCDGCLNVNNVRNRSPMLDTKLILDDVYDQNEMGNDLSRADYYALAGIVAVEVGIDNHNQFYCPYSTPGSCPDFIETPEFDFQYCRIDCSTSPVTDEIIPNFPSGHLDHKGTLDFFRWEFDLQVNESVALLGGGHTFGGATGELGTGFKGMFKGDQDEAARFNNKYFQLLLDTNEIDYRNVNKELETHHDAPRWQWDGYKNGVLFNMMLNTDVSLVYDIKTELSGESSCKDLQTTCGVVSPFDGPSDVVLFARDVNKFLETYVIAYNKMTMAGNYGGLRTPS